MSIRSLLLVALNVGAVVSQTTTILDVVGADADLSGLTQLLTLTNLATFLDTTSGATLFAPINSAFGVLDPKFLGPEWILHLTNLVSNHVLVPAVLTSTDLTDGLTVASAVAENFTVSVTGTTVSLSGDNFASSTVIEADLTADNGVVHKVDGLLLSDAVSDNLVEVLEMVDGNPFSIFLALANITGLSDSLMTDDQTVLVPTNSVFEALDPIIIAALTDPTNIALTTDILSNHIIPGPMIFPSTELLMEPTLTTALGEELTVATTDVADPMVLFTTPGGNTATGFALDGLGANGVVHAIDMILFPTDFNFPTLSPAPTVATPVADPTAAPILTTLPPITGSPSMFVPEPTFAPISMPPVLKLPTDDVVQIFALKCTKVATPVEPTTSGKGMSGGMMSSRRDLVVHEDGLEISGSRYLLDEFCVAVDDYCAALYGGKGKGGMGGMSGMMMGGGRRDLTEAFTPDLCGTLVPPSGPSGGMMMMGMSGMMMMSSS